MHARTQIREAVVTLLKGRTSAGHNVFEARVYPLDDPNLPALLIYTKNETLGEQTLSRPRTQKRELRLTIELYVKAKGNVDVMLDDFALEVEQIIAADVTLGGVVKDIVLESTDIQLSDDGERPVGVAILNYACFYVIKEHQPDALI